MARSSRRPTLNGLAGAQSARGAGLSPTLGLWPAGARGAAATRRGSCRQSRVQRSEWLEDGTRGARPPAGALRVVTLTGHRGSLAPPTARRPLTSVWAAGNGGCWGFSLPWRPLSRAGQCGAEGTGGGVRGRSGLALSALPRAIPPEAGSWAGVWRGAGDEAFRSLSSHSRTHTLGFRAGAVAAARSPLGLSPPS